MTPQEENTLTESIGITPLDESRYKLDKKKLGEGGMGQVWLAWDDCEKKRVAAKCTLSKYTLPEKIRIYFLKEIKIHTGLEHPNILRSFGFTIKKNQFT